VPILAAHRLRVRQFDEANIERYSRAFSERQRSLEVEQPIRNRLPHEGKSNLREFLGKTLQTEGVFPAHLPGFLLEEEHFKVALQKAVIGANLGEGDFPPATKTAHCFGSDPKKFRRLLCRDHHMGVISRDFVFMGNGNYVHFEGSGTISLLG
jgi:hypothetical protein